MTDTCGPTRSGSSENSSPAKSTASRSPARLRSDAFQEVLNQTLNLPGSTLYSVTLKQHTTPAGRVSSRPRASARRTSGTEPTGWPTPNAGDPKAGQTDPPHRRQKSLPRTASRAGWTTATVRDWKDSGADIAPREDGKQRLDQLPRQANLAGWPTPDAQMMNDAADPEKHMARLQRLKEKHGNGNGAGLPIGQACHLAGWQTPVVADNQATKGRSPEFVKGRTALSAVEAAPFGPARITADGSVLTGSSAEMPSGGLLNPAHSRWLMGYPAAWCLSAVRYIRKKRAASGSKATATRSSRSKPHNSSSPAKQRDPHSISAEDLA